VYKETKENCALLRHDAAFSGNSLPTFRNNPSVPSSGIKKSKKKAFFLDTLIYFSAEAEITKRRQIFGYYAKRS